MGFLSYILSIYMVFMIVPIGYIYQSQLQSKHRQDSNLQSISQKNLVQQMGYQPKILSL